MPLILVDTDILIDYLAGIPPALEGFEKYANRLQTTAISCFELLSGAREGKRGDLLRRLVAALHVVPLDRKAAERAATVRQNLEAAGSQIGMADSLIAGIALAHRIPLWTRNHRHFERVAGLELVKFQADKNV